MLINTLMKMKNIFLLFIILIINFCNAAISLSQNYKITVDLKECTDSSAYLAHYFDGRIFADDTTKLVNGKGVFQKEKKLDQGIYVIYLPSQKYFDLLIGEDQDFSFSANPNDFISSLKITGANESKAFHDFQVFMKQQNDNSKKLQEEFKANKESEEAKKKYQAAYKKADQDVRDYIDQLSKNFPDHSFVAKFAQLTLSPKIPDFSKEIPESTPDREIKIQKKSYLYNKDHYFDHVNFTDDRYMRTPILKNKLDHFFENILIQTPDSVIKESVKLIEAARPNKNFFQYITQYTLNSAVQSKIMGMDAAFVSLAKRYYLSGQATWADTTLMKKIKERVIKLQYNLIGQPAQDLTMETAEGEFARLSEVEAPLTILYFWEPDCGHCKKVTPRLKKDVYDKYKNKGLQVFAVCTQDQKEMWQNAIDEYDLHDFINCYDPHYQTNFRISYDIYSTPTIYLLDKNKKIIAKRLDIDTLIKFIDHELEKQSN